MNNVNNLFKSFFFIGICSLKNFFLICFVDIKFDKVELKFVKLRQVFLSFKVLNFNKIEFNFEVKDLVLFLLFIFEFKDFFIGGKIV